MDKELKAKWVSALRSGEYKQTNGALCRDGAYCCLGVLLDLSKLGAWEHTQWGSTHYEVGDSPWPLDTEIGPHLLPRFGLSEQVESQLIDLNDGDEKKGIRRHDFSEIADYIEANL